MEFVRTILNNAFILEYFIACLLFLLPLNHRAHFPLCMAASFAAHYLLGATVYFLISYINGLITAAFLFSFLIGVGMFFICAELSVSDAVFGAACSFAV